ncbi:MAG: endonuclease [Candidatus Aminicenantes bacterium]|nr:endonuclease [Candidatus Aminicenantes bacterium]NIN91041.1 endonuclease [Candidatus Aminicenantes bacterium]NIO87830.1 endonuclease [Candidatus Aminicenantes bacterium]NIR12033.1 endonuclease [Candidatus Aminicenantes bacterium]NIT29674.1 endonuclease [Candidatus Aminicenantes bacterium]
MFPIRLSIATLNLWKTKRWSKRQSALKKFVNVFCPDILCVQELKSEVLKFLDKVLPVHTRVHDDFIGWTDECNIFWKTRFFENIEYGAEEIGILAENRKLFWIRLKLRGTDRTVFISTAHFTYQEHHDELKTGLSPRIKQSRNTVLMLKKLVINTEPAFFAGDLNDTVNPLLILHEAGYDNCFTALSIPCPSTFPSYPTGQYPSDNYVRFLNQTRDWIVANQYSRPIIAQVPHCYYGETAPSDHWPVLAVYEI